MQKTIRILMLLAVTMLAGSGVRAQNLGQIFYTYDVADGGVLVFYTDATCKQENMILVGDGGNSEPIAANSLDENRTVYVLAFPDDGYKLGAADATTLEVEFITATETVAMSGGNNARTRADGDAIAVTLVRTDGQAGIYKFQMPAAVNGIASDVTVTAAFPEHTVAKLGDTGYEHITFIDYETDAQTGTLTAVSRSTEDLKDANNQPVPVYVLDGTETTLGTAGTSESPTEAWYVCLTPATANNGKGLEYNSDTDNDGVELRLANYCHVHLILADGSLMTVGGENSVRGIVGSNFTIYGQGGTDGAGQSAEGVLNVTGSMEAMIIYGDLTINGGQVNAASPNSKTIDVEGGDIAIHGGIVKASSDNALAIYAEGGDIAITGGSVICTAGLLECSYNGSGGHLTISGGKVNVLRVGDGIEAKSLTISGGQVEASAINAYKDISLGWAAASDYIKAVSFTTTSGVVKTAGKRFVALDESAGEGLPTATAIVPANATAGGGFELSDIEGQTLRPVDGYLLGLCPGLGVYRNGSAAPALEFTMAGDETTHYYIYKENDALTLSVGGVEDGFNGTVYKAGTPVEILQEDPTDPTALPTACTEFDEDDHSMNMPGKDLKIVGYRAYMSNVDYLIAQSDELIQVNMDELNFADKKAYILDGHDHMLYGFYNDEDYNQVGSSGFYVLEAKAKDTSGWMKDSEGNWMLTTNGNMFECRGSVGIILTDGSALCVGTESNPFPGSAVIYGDYDLNFFTQSEPGIPLDENGNLMVYSDNRGRMEIYSSGASGAKAIHAERDITLTNVVLSGGESPLEFNLYAKGNIYINGGQYDFASFNSTKSFFFNPISSTDELHATSFSTDNDMINIADGKALADREYPTTALSGAVPATEAAGKKLTELKTISGENGRIITAGAGTADGGGLYPSGVGGARGANMVLGGNYRHPEKIVLQSGSAVKSCYVTGLSASGELGIAPNSAVVNGQPVDCSDLLLGSVVNENADGTGKTKHSTVNVLTTEGQLSGSASGEALPGKIATIGSGTDNDVLVRGTAAAQNVAENGYQMIAAGNGTNTVGELAAAGTEGEIINFINQMRNQKKEYIEAINRGESGSSASKKFKSLVYRYMRLTNLEISTNPMEVDLDYLASIAPAVASLATNQPIRSDASEIALGYFNVATGTWDYDKGNLVSFKNDPARFEVQHYARMRAAGDETRLTMTFVPVDYNPNDVLPEGEIRLFMTKAELLSIAIYQREHPEEVAQARARGALMIDTTTPETTAIIGRLMVTEQAQPGDEYWYSLDGRRLPSAPTAKGIYVHHGRKVVIR